MGDGKRNQMKGELEKSVKSIVNDNEAPLKTYFDAQQSLVELTLNSGLPLVTNEEEGLSLEAKARFDILLHDVFSGAIDDKKRAAKGILQLIDEIPQIWVRFKSDIAIRRLLSPLEDEQIVFHHPCLQEDLVAIIMNISFHEGIKDMILNLSSTIKLIFEALRKGTIIARRNAGAAIVMLSEKDSNKRRVGSFGGVESLIEVIRGSDLLCFKEVALQALTKLCIIEENKVIAVHNGVIPIILQSIKSNILVHELLPLLLMLSSSAVGAIALRECHNDVVPLMLFLIEEGTSESNKEVSVCVLYNMYNLPLPKFHGAFYKLKNDAKNSNGVIVSLAKNGTEKARAMAKLLLDQLDPLSL